VEGDATSHRLLLLGSFIDLGSVLCSSFLAEPMHFKVFPFPFFFLLFPTSSFSFLFLFLCVFVSLFSG